MLADVKDVAEMLKCSKRHVLRMSKDGRIPSPVKLGALTRWRRAGIELWIKNAGATKTDGNTSSKAVSA